jgi:glycosyltransferase involved in cell wall biosynthesis
MKVSVIVPVYNTKDYLDRCLASLVNQSLKEIEIIVINDGSKEDVEPIIKKYKDKIIYIKNTNHGIGYTRNLGIKKSSGEYIGFVDSDDFVNKEMYLDYYNYAKENDLDIVVANYNRCEPSGIKEMNLNHFEIGNIRDNKKILVDIDYGPCNKIFKRKMILNHNILFEEKLKYEDMPFVLKALKHSLRIGHLNQVYYNYNVRESSETTTTDKRDFDIFKIFDIINNYYKDEKDLSLELEYLNVSKLLNYNIVQRNQKNSKIRNKFIDKSFDYIYKNFPEFKKNKYLKMENFAKKLIKQSKIITKLYCFVYSIK